MDHSAKVAITLPSELYRRIERLRKQTHTSRSAMVQRALGLLLKEEHKQERVRAYLDAYRRNPETEEEIRAAKAAAVELLAEVPWE
jgi:metal-responsive CopG/Arc/MetJ family transcriptional regulator